MDEEKKCCICGEYADYHKIIDGKDYYLCYRCANEKYGIITLWVSRCNYCGHDLYPKYMVAKYDSVNGLYRSYCSTDCAMKELGYKLLDDEDDEDGEDGEE